MALSTAGDTKRMVNITRTLKTVEGPKCSHQELHYKSCQSNNNIESYLNMFKRVAVQQEWVKKNKIEEWSGETEEELLYATTF